MSTTDCMRYERSICHVSLFNLRVVIHVLLSFSSRHSPDKRRCTSYWMIHASSLVLFTSDVSSINYSVIFVYLRCLNREETEKCTLKNYYIFTSFRQHITRHGKMKHSPTRVYNSICLVYGNYRQYYEFPFFYE